MQTVIALLPMKGHSERVPNKNLRDFDGRPLFEHVLTSLLAAERISEVAVNTDSPEIAALARKHSERVVVIERPDNIRGDLVPMNDIIAYDLTQLDGEHFFQTHSTNPLLTTNSMDRAIDRYFDELGRLDSLFSVTRLQTRLYDQDGRPINHDPAELLRTQDLPPVFEENSNIYIFSKDSFKSDGNKRIGSFLFLLYLQSHDLDRTPGGRPRFADNALVALALLVAESDPTQKELMIRLIQHLMGEGA